MICTQMHLLLWDNDGKISLVRTIAKIAQPVELPLPLHILEESLLAVHDVPDITCNYNC